MKKPTVHVSDHALLRYLERVLEVDIETHRRQIGARVSRVLDIEGADGASGVVMDGFSYKLQGRTVTTIMEAGSANIRTGHRSGTKERPE